MSRAHLETAVGQALEHVLAADDAVVVVRSARIQLVLNASAPSVDRRITEGVAAQVAEQIARTISRPGDDEGIARFDNQPHYVASFLGALVRGWAWDRWFFGAFHPYRRPDVSATILAVLEANRNDLPRILTYLRRADTLEAVLASLGTMDRSALQSSALDLDTASASFRPLADAAFRIAEALGWWQRNPARERDAFNEFIATKPLEPNWRDATSLSATVVALARQLLRSENLHRSISADAAERLRHLFDSELNWLDELWIATQLAAIGDAPHADSSERPLIGSVGTPHQRELLARIRALVEQGACVLDRSAPSSSANVLRVLAALGDRWPDQTMDDAAISLIEHVLRAWYVLERSTEESDHGVHRREELALVRSLGSQAQELLDSLSKRASVRGAAHPDGKETRAAGVFLLTRPVLDLDLPTLARQADVPLPALLLGVAAGIFGSNALLRERIDPGVAVWTALDTEITAAEVTATLSTISPDALYRLQRALLGRLVGQRHLDAEALSITSAAAGDGIWSIATDRKGLCWPLTSRASPEIAVTRFVQEWAEATGEEPEIVANERDTASDVATILGAPVVPEFLALPLSAVTSSILRTWARWLPGVGDSSLPFLIRNCIHRAGRVHMTSEAVDVELDTAALDVVLEMAGYFRPLPDVGWFNGRALRLAVRR